MGRMTARDIAGALPDIDSLKNRCRSMAMAEAILNPDGELFYEMPVDIEALRQVYELRPLGLPQIVALDSGASVSEVVAAAREMGYPLADDLRSDAS